MSEVVVYRRHLGSSRVRVIAKACSEVLCAAPPLLCAHALLANATAGGRPVIALSAFTY